MTWRWIGLGGITAVLAAGVACSYDVPPMCPNGMWPFDGQSNVDLDTVIELQTGEALPTDLPSLGRGVSLRSKAGKVPVEIEIDEQEGLVRLIPKEPLQPDTRYWLAGIDWWSIEDANRHWWPSDDFGRDYIEITFTTAAEPRLLGVLPDDEALVVVFSEAVDLDSLEGRLFAADEHREHELTVLGHYRGEPNLVRVLDPAASPVVGELRVEEGVTSLNGDPVVIDVEQPIAVPATGHRSANLDRVLGQPWCAYGLWE